MGDLVAEFHIMFLSFLIRCSLSSQPKHTTSKTSLLYRNISCYGYQPLQISNKMKPVRFATDTQDTEKFTMYMNFRGEAKLVQRPKPMFFFRISFEYFSKLRSFTLSYLLKSDDIMNIESFRITTSA